MPKTLAVLSPLCVQQRHSVPGKANARKRPTQARSGLGLLEWAGVVPQGLLVSAAKQSWNVGWMTLMKELAPQSKDGQYVRPSYAFKYKIENSPSARFPAESGRYHLYVGNACPWCHRALLAITLYGLQQHITVTNLIDDAEKARRGGWIFGRDLHEQDPVFNATDLWEVYNNLQPNFVGRCTAPLLVDKKTKLPVSNDSAAIVRMLQELGNAGLEGCHGVSLYPLSLREEIDRMNEYLYERVNNGVYRCGFATSQDGYDKAVEDLFLALDEINSILGKNSFLTGPRLTESDVFLYPTIVRFDSIYGNIFKCTAKRVSDLPNLHRWLQDMYNLPIKNENASRFATIRDTFSLQEAFRSYYSQLFPLNPGAIVPKLPENSLPKETIGSDAVNIKEITYGAESIDAAV